MMLAMALVSPAFLALSLFPVGTKPLATWGVSFLTLGFCKICFSLVSGLSSMAIVLADPNNVDMLVTSVVIGLLAPVLAISVASGSGLAKVALHSPAKGLVSTAVLDSIILVQGKKAPIHLIVQDKDVKIKH
jgi:hypothetical protein